MAHADGTEPIDDEELLYRRIPASQDWYDPSKEPNLAVPAFRPRKYDTTGISLSRAKYKSLREAAQNPRGKSCYIAVLRAGDLRSAGIEVVPRPEDGDPGHAEIPSLNYENRKSDQAKEWIVLLAHELAKEVEGPFEGEDPPASNG